MQAPYREVFLNCDSQHLLPDIRPAKAHVRRQISPLRNQLSASGLTLSRSRGVRLLVPGSEHDASNWAAWAATVDAMQNRVNPNRRRLHLTDESVRLLL